MSTERDNLPAADPDRRYYNVTYNPWNYTEGKTNQFGGEYSPNAWTLAVRDFHYKFGHPVRKKVQWPPEAELSFIKNFGREEWGEIVLGINTRDMVKVADNIGDMIWILIGFAYRFGFPLARIFELIEQANMAKLGPDGKPIYREDGKVMKPPGWVAPDYDIACILIEHGWDQLTLAAPEEQK